MNAFHLISGLFYMGAICAIIAVMAGIFSGSLRVFVVFISLAIMSIAIGLGILFSLLAAAVGTGTLDSVIVVNT